MAATTARVAQYLAAAAEQHLTPAAARQAAEHLAADFRAELDDTLNPTDCTACRYFTGHASWCNQRGQR